MQRSVWPRTTSVSRLELVRRPARLKVGVSQVGQQYAVGNAKVFVRWVEVHPVRPFWTAALRKPGRLPSKCCCGRGRQAVGEAAGCLGHRSCRRPLDFGDGIERSDDGRIIDGRLYENFDVLRVVGFLRQVRQASRWAIPRDTGRRRCRSWRAGGRRGASSGLSGHGSNVSDGGDGLSTATSTSVLTVKRPRLNRTDSNAASRETPIARRTSDGSIEPELQALPVDTATGSVLAATASASAPSKRTLAVFGRRRATLPTS